MSELENAIYQEKNNISRILQNIAYREWQGLKADKMMESLNYAASELAKLEWLLFMMCN